MRKGRFAALLLALVLCLTACAGTDEAAQADSFAIRIACESEGVYQVFYTYYIDGERRGMGGVADLDGKELSPDAPLEFPILKEYFEDGDGFSAFSIDFSPYGEGDTVEMGTTAPLEFAVSWGGTYTVVLSGDAESGFTAELVS